MPLSKRLHEFRLALLLSYAGAGEDVYAQISGLSDDASIVGFFEHEWYDKEMRIYLLVDQMNALEISNGDSSAVEREKHEAKNVIESIRGCALTVESASANNKNAAMWERKQLNIARMLHHGGLDDAEFKEWVRHFGASPEAALNRLEPQEAQRVDYATGRVPLFLNCWSLFCTAEEAWKCFISVPEVRSAKKHLREFLDKRMSQEGSWWTHVRDAQLSFMLQEKVCVLSKDYDCRYLYVDADDFGRCICGIYRDILGEVMQGIDKQCFLRPEWRSAIFRQLAKGNPNPSLLGFMVEHEVLAFIAREGIMLRAGKCLRVDDVVWFESGDKSLLTWKAGCIMYVPSAFNYRHVDAVIRAQVGEDELCSEVYNKVRFHVIGVQVTLGSLSEHEHSEREFFSPKTIERWYPSKAHEDVGRWFVWIALGSEIREHVKDLEALSAGLVVKGEVMGKTRTKTSVELDHLALFLHVEDFEPYLEEIER